MTRLNGFGTTLLGISKMDQHNCATATKWFTILFLPLFPMQRYLVEFNDKSSVFYLRKKTPLSLLEIAKTYLFGWIIYPAILAVPLLLKNTSLSLDDSMELALTWWIGGVIILYVLQIRKTMPKYAPKIKKSEPETPVEVS